MTTANLPLPIRLARLLHPLRRLRGGQKAALKALPRYPGQQFIVDNRGVRVRCDLSSYLEFNFAAFTDYEWDEKRLFIAAIPADRRRTILDIGANVGGHSLFFAKHFKTVVAVDPNPMVFERLAYNISLNPDLDVRAFMVGLSDEAGTLQFHQPLASFHNQGTGTFDPEFAPEESRLVELPIEIGDELVARVGAGPIDAVKIDVQGLEPNVLRGLAGTLEANRPAIWLEASESTLRAIAASPGGLAGIIPPRYRLRAFGVKRVLGLLTYRTLVDCPDFNPVQENDYLLTPREWDAR